MHSTHPLAKAVVKSAEKQQISPFKFENTQAIFGSGVKGSIETDIFYLGNPELFNQLGLDITQYHPIIEELQSQAKTVVILGNESHITGIIAMQDTIRDNAYSLIKELHKLGIRVVMLTGDNNKTAEHIANKLDIDDFRAELKPEDKVSAIKELMQQGETLMVGDGVNDAPALATATCGVAMGAAGSDAAIEAADIALMADDLTKLQEAMQLGQQARKVSKQNIIFAICVLVILIPAGVGGYISIAVAVLAHEVSELIAVANGLRAGRLSKVNNSDNVR